MTSKRSIKTLPSTFASFVRGLGSRNRRSVHVLAWIFIGTAIGLMPSPTSGIAAAAFVLGVLLWRFRITWPGFLLLPVGWIVGAGISMMYMFSGPAIENNREQIPFNSVQWIAGSQDHGTLWPTRLRMADDLVNSKRLLGKSKDEVVALLGFPDISHTNGSQKTIEYVLGPERSLFGIDSESIVVTLDANRRVKIVENMRR